MNKGAIMIMKNDFLFFGFFIFCMILMQKSYAQSEEQMGKILPTPLQSHYDVKWYFLNLHVENNTTYLEGDVTIKATVTVALLDTFSFHLSNLYSIDSIKVNQQNSSFYSNSSNERFIPNLAFSVGSEINVQVFYHGSVPSGGFFSGISTATHWTYPFSTTWTLSEPNAAYQWFPVKQDLQDKIDSVRFYATTTLGNRVGCNGILEGIDTLPENKVRYRWNANHYPIAYYLISFAVAQYQDYSYYCSLPNTTDSLLVQNYIYNTPNCLWDNKTIIDRTGEMIYFFSELYGMYPFKQEKYGHTFAPIGGAMEHQTMTTTGYFTNDLIAHELAHQWFGDLVTCASWEHIFVNESFAAYSEFLWNEHFFGFDEAMNNFHSKYRTKVLNNGQYGSIYVPVEDIDNENRIFNETLSYAKGSTVLHLLRFIVGDDHFLQILRHYLNTHAYENGTIDDFKEATETITGEDFDYFFNQWLYGEGYPNFDIIWEVGTNGKLRFRSVETSTAPSVTPFFRVPFQLRIHNNFFTDTVTFFQTEPNQIFEYDIPDGNTNFTFIFNPNKWLIATATLSQGIVDITTPASLDKLSIFPNPTHDNFTINASFPIHRIEVYTPMGSLLFSIRPTDAFSTTCSMSPYAKGMYILKIYGEDEVVVKKLMIE